jgi:hypothetical protein
VEGKASENLSQGFALGLDVQQGPPHMLQLPQAYRHDESLSNPLEGSFWVEENRQET